MLQLQQRQAELNQLKIDVKVISFDDRAMAKTYSSKMKLEWPILLDQSCNLYNAYGMYRGSWWDIYHPFSILKYLKLILGSTRPGKPGKDWRQLGGNVLIDSNGIVRLHHVSLNPHDRPSVDTLLRCRLVNQRIR